MKLISTVAFIPVMVITASSIPGITYAQCPSKLTPDDMHECIMMEGNGDLDYREWAPEFYKKFNPGKVDAINEAYKTEDLKAAQKNRATEKTSYLSVSSGQ
ncbi:MAG TPA: hypothetical protein ENI98_01475 [Gammaproteobacteria bacterium]|nr:hypothetical protein [Gammaproteobacteria bacterium]